MSGLYTHYLQGLCKRRGWDDPTFEAFETTKGFLGLVIVNNRQYQTDIPYESERLALENAAMRAYLVCRNFSVNDGMIERNGIIQGLPAEKVGGKLKAERRFKALEATRMSISSRASATTASAQGSYEPSDSWSQISMGPDMMDDQVWMASIRRTATVPTTRPSQDYLNNSANPEGLAKALKAQDYNITQWLLEKYFEQVAVEEYAWLTDLKQLGYSALEITDELMEKSINGSWILQPFEVPQITPPKIDFHLPNCVHNHHISQEKKQPFIFSSKDEAQRGMTSAIPTLTEKELVEYLCGVGGVRPSPEGTNDLEFGSLTFKKGHSEAEVILVGPEDNSVIEDVLKSVEQAAGCLQRLGGCCDSFTYLYVNDGCVELERVSLSAIRRLRELVGQPQQQPGLKKKILSTICDILPFRESSFLSEDLCSQYAHLTAQFLALALLSYSQAHCGPIKPFFLDRALETVFLTSQTEFAQSMADNQGLSIVGGLVELTCMGKMTDGPVFAFRFRHTQASQDVLANLRRRSPVLAAFMLPLAISVGTPVVEAIAGLALGEAANTALRSWLQKKTRMDLLACAEDIADTWGPGGMLVSDKEPDQLFAVYVGGGAIVHRGLPYPAPLKLHWSKAADNMIVSIRSFSRTTKFRIGASIIQNERCKARPRYRLMAQIETLGHLGTFRDYWQLTERQAGLGLQVGQMGVAHLQSSQTWLKMPGRTKKSAMLRQQSIFTGDLDSFYGVQVSSCTGCARRVRLRELLAEVIPAYVGSIFTDPPLWNSLWEYLKGENGEESGIMEVLCQGDFEDRVKRLDPAHRLALSELMFEVLNVLGDTGVDRKDDNFIVACIQPGSAPRSINIPCKRESSWTRMLADSTEMATFAYITTQCLEAPHIQCDGADAPWVNSTSLFWTTVLCHEKGVAQTRTPLATNQSRLRHSEAYLIGQPDTALLVQVNRNDEEEDARLLVSNSHIPLDYLYRLFRKCGTGKPRMLKEVISLNANAEGVLVLVG